MITGFAGCVRVTRKPTEQEKAERRSYLMERTGVAAWLQKIEAMPDGSKAKVREMAKYQGHLDDIEKEVENGLIIEWVTTHRAPTPEEQHQREIDLQEADLALAAEEEDRQRLLGLVRTAAGNVKLSLAEYLSLHPVPGLRPEDIEDE